MKFKKQTGFTLIELLVVIAIIGILASIVLVSFPGAQKKAKDSRVIGAVAQARTVMTYMQANDGDFTNFSCTATDMVNLCAEVAANNGNVALSIVKVGSGASATACMSATLTAVTNQFYCADSSGKAGRTMGAGAPAAGCSATTGLCQGTLSD